MRKIKQAIAMVLGTVIWGMLRAEMAFAAYDASTQNNVLKSTGNIEQLLQLIVKILLYGLGAAATVGVVISGVLYLTARDNPQQVARAKMRLIEVAIGIAAWAMLYGLLTFLWPGFSWNLSP